MKLFRAAIQPRNQLLLIPTTLDALPANAPVRIFHEIVHSLDHGKLLASYSGGGAPAYHPVLLMEVLLFAYNEGVRSSRQIARMLSYDVRFMYLAEGQRPDFRTISDFRRRHEAALVSLFEAVVRLAMEIGLVVLEHVAVDGTKLEAAASRESVYDADKLKRKIAQAAARLKAILAEAEEADAAEADAEEATLPAELATARQRLARLQAIEQARAEAGISGSYVATDPESRIIKTRAGKRPAYNIETAVDSKAQIVLAITVTNSATDNHASPAVLDQVEINTGARPAQVSMDGGFWSPETLADAQERRIDVYLPPQAGDHAAEGFIYQEETDSYTCRQGETLRYARTCVDKGRMYRIYRCSCRVCPRAVECHGASKRYKYLWRRQWSPQELAHHEKMTTDAAKAIYRTRAQTVEPVFGQWKTLNRFTRLLLYGIAGAKIEALLVGISHNLRKCAQVWPGKAIYQAAC